MSKLAEGKIVNLFMGYLINRRKGSFEISYMYHERSPSVSVSQVA